MPAAIDNLEWSIECPQCDHKFKKTFIWINRNRTFSCPNNCGAGFSYSGNEINNIKRELGKLNREFKKLNRTLTIRL